MLYNSTYLAYPQDRVGYYYTYKVNKAIENLDNESLMFFSNKLNYFIDRQLALKARNC